MKNTTTNIIPPMPSMLKTFIDGINYVANWFAPEASSVTTNASTAPGLETKAPISASTTAPVAVTAGLDAKSPTSAGRAKEPGFCATIGGLFRSIAKGATLAHSICNSDKGVVSKAKNGVELFKALGSTALGSVVSIFQGVIDMISSIIETLTGFDKMLKGLKPQKMVGSLLSSLMSGDDDSAPSFNL